MEGQSQPEQFRLRELDEVVVPVEHGRFVIKADFEKFKEHVLAPLPLADEQKTAYSNRWTVKNLHMEPMKAYLDKTYKESSWKVRLQEKLAEFHTTSIGLHVGGHINIDVAKIIHNIDRKLERYTDEGKEMLVKQTIDKTLRHEEEHLRQWMMQDAANSTKIDAARTEHYTKLKAIAEGGYIAGMTGMAGASILLMAYQRRHIAEDVHAAQHILQQLFQSTDPLETTAKILAVASIATASGSIALDCVNHRKNYYDTPWEQAAREQGKPEYFSEKSPLEVSFERDA